VILRKAAWFLLTCFVGCTTGGASPHKRAIRSPVLVRTVQASGGFVGITPDQKSLITVDRNGTVVVLDKVTGRERTEWVTGGQINALECRGGNSTSSTVTAH
jgi:hypothetical protein